MKILKSCKTLLKNLLSHKKLSEELTILRVYLVSVLMLMFFFRLALPQYIKFMLFPLLAIAGIIAFFVFLKNWRLNLIEFRYQPFLPFFFAALFYVISFLITSGKQDTLIRDFINGFTVLLFWFVGLFLVKSEKELTLILKAFKKYAVIISTSVAILGLIKLYFQLIGVVFGFLKVDNLGYPGGATLAIDNNFFTLICLFGIILILELLFKNKSGISSIFLQFSLLALLTNIFLSTSRRGIIIAFAVLIGFILVWVISFLTKNENFRLFRRNSLGFIIVSISLISIVIYQIMIVSPLERNKRLSFSRYDQIELQTFVNSMTLSIRSIFKGETEYWEINDDIWQTSLDPLFPYTGWATGKYTPVTELPGENAEIVPRGSVGAMIDKNSGSLHIDDNAYYYSKLIEKDIINKSRFLSSIYCYVSPEFNGDWMRISTFGNVKGLLTSYYDMNAIGTWQKLQTSFYADSGSIKSYIYLSSKSTASFDSLKGYAVFAYPELKKISFDPKRPITWAGTEFEEISVLPGSNSGSVPAGSSALRLKSNAFKSRNNIKYSISNVFSLNKDSIRMNYLVNIYAYVSEDFNGDEVSIRAFGKHLGRGISHYDLKNKGKWERLGVSVTPDDDFVDVNIYVKKALTNESDDVNGDILFAYPEIDAMEFDPRNPLTWASKKYKEVKKLPGINYLIVPKNSIGYRLDNESNYSLSRLSGRHISSTIIGRYPIEKGKRYISSVYCYVSDDFDGELVRLGAQGKFYGPRSDFYNLNRKGEWQHLYLNNYGDSSFLAPSLNLEIPKNRDVESLKGYVIFAYPDVNIYDYDPSNPVSYSNTDFKREFPLKGKNSSIVPGGVAGYQLNNSAKGKVLKNSCLSSTEFNSIHVNSEDSVYASVYCYVSEEFNGNDVRLQFSSNVRGLIISRYNLKNSGQWVKLEIKGKVENSGLVTGVIFFSQNDVTNFNNLKGYVTFACPEIKVIKKDARETSHNSVTYRKNIPLIGKAAIFSLWQAFQDKDTSYQESIVNDLPEFKKEKTLNNFSGPRLDRWRYALHIYRNEYNTGQKLIGSGFGYTGKFAAVFLEVEGDFDYPHNPFLSVLLYSGIIGLLAYSWLLIYAFYYYYVYRKKYWTLGLCFAVTFMFAFFSANSPFDPAIMGVLTILPFIIHFFHQKALESSELVE